jgi:hypothetical protein
MEDDFIKQPVDKNGPIDQDWGGVICYGLAGVLRQSISPSRELSLALTKLEEAALWLAADASKREEDAEKAAAETQP